MAEETTVESKSSNVWKAIVKFLKDLWIKIFLPALKDVISVSVNRTTQHILYHTPLDAGGLPNNGSRPTPTGNAWRPSDRAVQARSACWIESEPNRFGLRQVCSTDRRTLEALLAKMQARLADPNSGHTVTVGEMYGFANLPAAFADYQDGWTSLSGCNIRFDPQTNSFVLMMAESAKL